MLDLDSVNLRSCATRMTQEDENQEPQQEDGPPSLTIDHKNDIYPFCIVWTSIPVISWVFPFFGHVGIGTSEGIIRNFVVSRHVCEDSFAYGSPDRYVQLKYQHACGWKTGWDNAIEEATTIFEEKKHGSIFNNCFTYVCTALNLMKYDEKTNWNQFKLLLFLWWNMKYVSKKKIITTYIPSLIICCFLAITGFMIHESIQQSENNMNDN
ncbi:hypothetical protein L9F63_015164 [Diploptera punctata]|uniref:Transmembrane protein 222 n=1 Tax=Diploptera punctata TaxID=6984 RepID=A0AAD8A6C5_DIPPU|nr:hypothetical protein L9F63_015164 [Diploptera punctata]